MAVKITIRPNGPYLVEGEVEVTDVNVTETGTRALLKPMVFAKLLQAAAIGETERVLDAGCATGYSSAILARLAGSVHGRDTRCARRRPAALDRLGSGRERG